MASLNGVIGNGASLFQSYETTPAAEKVRRHPKYYLNGGDIHFLVENYIFRVHRYFFERESQIFREKLGAPPPPGQTPKGASDTNPFPLDDVREIDFSRFLWVFYNPKYSVYDANAEEWISIMKLAFEWKFAEVKRLSTRYLEKFTLDPIRKIELYQWYQVDKRLLIPSYLAVINRQEPLTLDEGRRLTLETALLIATARECARGRRLDNGVHSPIEATVDADSMISIVKEVFALGDTSPSSPCLEPIAEGAGPSVFTATLMSPSKIITSPPREDAMSPTPAGKGPTPTIIGGPISQLQPLVAPVSTTPPPPAPFLVQPKPQQATSQPVKEPSVPSMPPYLTTFNQSAAPSPISAKKTTFDVMKEANLLPSTPAATTPSTPAPAPAQAASGDASKTGASTKPETSSTAAPPAAVSGAASTGAASSDATKGDTKDVKGASGKDVQPPAKPDVKPADNKSGNTTTTTEPKPADPKPTDPKAADPPKSTVPDTPKDESQSRPQTPSTPNPNADDGASEGGADSFSQKWLKKASAARAGKTNAGGQGSKRR